MWLGVVAAEDSAIGDRYGVFSQVQAHPQFLFPFPFPVPHHVSIRFGDAFLRGCSFSCFPSYPLYSPSRIDRGKLPGVAALRPRLRLGAPGCLLGGALGGLSAVAPGYRQSHI